MRFRLARGRCTTCLNAPPKSLHQVNYVCRLGPLGALDGLAFLLFLEQLLQRILVLVFKLARFNIPFSDISSAKYRIAISPTDPRVQGPLNVGRAVVTFATLGAA
jgi:hypothetical protein